MRQFHSMPTARLRAAAGSAAAALLASAIAAQAARAPIADLSADPYRGAIVIDAATGATLFEDNADAAAYPASIVKLMDLLIVLEKARQGGLRLGDQVRVSAAASRMGGSQVYLKEGEVFSVEDLLYALVIQSANDAAVALAEHVAGTTEAFVALMNAHARRLGMHSTVFASVHGLPPAAGQKPDVSTARDLAVLARELTRNYPQSLAYTSAPLRGFRNNTFEMRTHNRLLEEVPGCDGLKTGYFRAGGYSVAASAAQDGRRVIAVVLGSRDRIVREARAKELLARGFLTAPPPPPPAPPPAAQVAEAKPEATRTPRRWPRRLGIAALVAGAVFVATWLATRRRLRYY
ncbi:MAG: D-alanyl-D-alanine carboxypeptidase [Lentisphaerae bacterium]|nr:D-alanyl-D-alanine carboxypeptidase [Lentisphaerota bacterium]